MSQVTKRALEASLKHLLLQKPLNKITINDIAEDCGIHNLIDVIFAAGSQKVENSDFSRYFLCGHFSPLYELPVTGFKQIELGHGTHSLVLLNAFSSSFCQFFEAITTLLQCCAQYLSTV